MDIFAPENRESIEKYRESRVYSSEIEKQILDRISEGLERFPDIMFCPHKNCRNTLKIELLSDFIRVYCNTCGWEKIISRNSRFQG